MPLHAADVVMGPPPRPATVLAALHARAGHPAPPPILVRHPQATIGSDAACDLVVVGDGVAGRHAQLRLQGGVWTYIDFGTPGGSQVDGASVRGEALLAPGSAVRVGAMEFAFGPRDAWEDSPVERRAGDRAPVILMPPPRRTAWPGVVIALAVALALAAAYFLLRNG